MPTPTIFSLGHSNLSEIAFLDILTSQPIHTIIDVRSHPSSKFPQFYHERLKVWLPHHGYTYEWWPELSSWAPRHRIFKNKFLDYGIDITPYLKGGFEKIIGVAPNTKWTGRLLYYSFFMMLPEFMDAVAKLIERSKLESIAILCSEANPQQCHRMMICDYLWHLNIDSWHLQPKLIKHSEIINDRLEWYDSRIIEAWQNRPNLISEAHNASNGESH